VESALNFLDRVVAAALVVVRAVCIVFASALFIVVVAAVVARYGLGRAVSWTEEVPRYLLIWISFLGAAAGVARREHVGFDLVFEPLPPALRRVVATAIALMMFGFGWIMFRYGIVFVQDFGADLMETIPFTNYWYYTAMPVSGALLMLFALKLVIEAMRGGASAVGSSVD
jgi:TRAP-type C4-dicarboxylate transport system permease small subunit